MKQKYLDFSVWMKKQLKDPAFKAEYDRQQPEFAVIEAMLKARVEKGFTQAKLAKKIGTKQSVISRLERGNANPSIGFLQKLAAALDTRLEIKFSAI